MQLSGGTHAKCSEDLRTPNRRKRMVFARRCDVMIRRRVHGSCGATLAHRARGKGSPLVRGKGSHGRRRRRAGARELAKNLYNEYNNPVFVVNIVDCS